MSTFRDTTFPIALPTTADKKARERFIDNSAELRRQRTFWQRATFACFVIIGLQVLGMAWIGSQSKLIPYVVQVDKLGATANVGRADTPMTVNPQSIKAHLARWIENTRSVYTDVAAEKKAALQAYTSINSKGAAQAVLNEYFTQNDPFKKAQTESVTVNVQSVQPITDKTWRVEWQEIHRDRNGGSISTLNEQATITIVINPPTDEETILVNPLGIYIDSFSWSQRL